MSCLRRSMAPRRASFYPLAPPPPLPPLSPSPPPRLRTHPSMPRYKPTLVAASTASTLRFPPLSLSTLSSRKRAHPAPSESALGSIPSIKRHPERTQPPQHPESPPHADPRRGACAGGGARGTGGRAQGHHARQAVNTQTDASEGRGGRGSRRVERAWFVGCPRPSESLPKSVCVCNKP